MNLNISDSSRLIGKIRLGDKVTIAQGTIIRSIDDSVKIDNSSLILENSVVIGMPNSPVSIGQKTVLGHKCTAIGVEIGNLCEVGNGVIFEEGVKVGDMCIFGEGSLIPKGTTIPDRSVVIGRPGKIIRSMNKDDINMILAMRNNDISLNDYIENIIYKKESDNMAKLHSYKDIYPSISESAKLYDSAEITGNVTIGDNSIIASGVKIIGDSHGPVVIGNNVHILENSVLHLLPDNELIIEDNVTIGPNAIIHGCTIGENTVIESGAIVCDNSVLGKNTLIKSGTLVPQRAVFENDSILEGFPCKKVGLNRITLDRPEWSIK